jgi:hypothetical protein
MRGLLAFIIDVIAGIPVFIQISGSTGKRTFSVQNPVNVSENFAEKWTQEHYTRFLSWHAKALKCFKDLLTSKRLGADVMLSRLGNCFGNECVVKAANTLGIDARSLHEARVLRVSPGQIGTAGATIPQTIYFGN